MESQSINMDDITDQELESLDCPTIRRQEREWEEVCSKISRDVLDELLKRLNHTLIDYRFYTESEGIVNKLVLIRSIDNSVNREKELFLKLIAPDKRYKYSKTCEAEIINYLKKTLPGRIPLPNVLDYCYDSEESLLQNEYVLMERVPGKTLEKALPENIADLPENLKQEFIDIIKAIRSVKFEHNLIGHFGPNMKIAPLFPAKEPHRYYLDFFNDRISYSIKEMRKIKKFIYVADLLEEKRIELLNRVEKSQKPNLNRLNFNDEILLSHDDLNPANVIVDPETFKINAILDWEWSHNSVDCLNFFDGFPYKTLEQKKEIQESLNKLMETELPETKKCQGSEFRRYLNEINDCALLATSYQAFAVENPNEKDIYPRQHITKFVEYILESLKQWDSMLNKYL